MQLIQEHQWPGLTRDYRALLAAAWVQMRGGDYQAAATGFENSYRFLLDLQPTGSRYHKGEALHNWGLALYWLGKPEDAVRETVAAFIEDAASLAEESERLDELDRPAAHNLVYLFGLAGPPLADLARFVRGYVGGGNLLPDPHALLATPEASSTSDGRTEPAGLRLITQIGAEPERTVFIGGWYGGGRLEGVLRPLRDIVSGAGYEGVIAADFAVPAGWRIDDAALALLGLCHFGVFDLSEPGGQMIEISRLSDRKKNGARTLAVFDKRVTASPRVSSGMTLEPLADYGITPVGYDDVSHLGSVVTTWLTPPPRH